MNVHVCHIRAHSYFLFYNEARCIMMRFNDIFQLDNMSALLKIITAITTDRTIAHLS